MAGRQSENRNGSTSKRVFSRRLSSRCEGLLVFHLRIGLVMTKTVSVAGSSNNACIATEFLGISFSERSEAPKCRSSSALQRLDANAVYLNSDFLCCSKESPVRVYSI